MINVEKSVAKLREICEAKGVCLQKFKDKIRVITKHGVFYVSVAEHGIGIKAKSNSVNQEDYWIYLDWVIVE